MKHYSAILFLSLIFFFNKSTFSQSPFDLPFGNDGIEAIDLGRSTDFFSSIAVQSTGKIVATGFTNYVFNFFDSLQVWRFNDDGSVDLTFGTNGRVYIPLEVAVTAKLVTDSSDRILIVSEGDYQLIRLLSNGGIDSSFADDGIFTLDGYEYFSSSPLIQPDGKIVLTFNYSDDYDYESGLLRLNDDGTPDNQFGVDGEAKFDFCCGGNLALQGDGKICMSGRFVARFLSDGTPDSSFGENGITMLPGFEGRSLAIQSDGRIVTSGYNYLQTDPYGELIRLTDIGSIDSSFGTNGIVTTSITVTGDQNVMVRADDKIVFTELIWNGSTYDPVIFRFEENGEPDLSFGLSGEAIVSFEEAGAMSLASMLRSDGKVLLAGQSFENGSQKMTITRTDADGAADASFGDEGEVMLSFDELSYDEPRSFDIRDDGKILVSGATNGFPILIRYLNDGTVDSSFGINGISAVRYFNYYYNTIIKLKTLSVGKIILATENNLIRCLENGPIDSSFADNGFLATINSLGENVDLIVQPDGKILLSGVDSMYFLRRYLSDGSPDLSFGNSGAVTFSNCCNLTDMKLALQSDGKIILGRSYGNLPVDAVLQRLNSDGSIDATFGSDGSVWKFISNDGSGHFYSILVQPDDKILICTSSLDSVKIYRINTDGSTDNSFSDDGLFVLNKLPHYSSNDNTWISLSLQPNDNIILFGYGYMNTATEMKCLQLTANGAIDSSFATDGILDFDVWSYPVTSLTQPDGKILLLGRKNIYGGNFYDADFFLARLFPDSTTTSTALLPSPDKLLIAPNPSSNQVTLYYNDYSGNAIIELHDVSGKIVLQKATWFLSGLANINIESLPSGVYEILIQTAEKRLAEKFVKE